jgi:hypothetical protein
VEILPLTVNVQDFKAQSKPIQSVLPFVHSAMKMLANASSLVQIYYKLAKANAFAN